MRRLGWLLLFATRCVADEPLNPKQALASFRLEPGWRVELVAAEPNVVAPVAIAFDERGRMFVAENRGYPTGPERGDIVMLEDPRGDGHFTKRTVFAEDLNYPNGLQPWKGGLLVTCAPDLLWLKDTDADGRADLRKVVFSGFSTNGSTQLRCSHPTFALDNWIYVATGLVGGSITSPDFPQNAPVALGRADLRFRPGTDQFENADGGGQFGMSFDEFGHRFICYNRMQVQHVVLASRYLRRNPHLAFSETVQNCPETLEPEPLKGHGAAARLFPVSHNITTADSHAGTYTAACGLCLWRGEAFSCDPTSNLVHRDLLTPKGATFAARRVRDGMEVLASTDDWFRPVNLTVGPDGALYVCDMYRKTIEHPDYLPGDVRKHTDFTGGKTMGRIWRLTPDERYRPARPRLDTASTKELCAQFRNPNQWWRITAQRLLVERHDTTAIPILKSALRERDPIATLHALHTLDSLGGLDQRDIERALSHPHPAVREHAVPFADPSHVVALADDADARVRFQCALALGDWNDPRRIPALANIAARDSADRWARAAVLSSVGADADKLISQRGLGLPFLSELGRLLGASEPPEKIKALLDTMLAVDGADSQLALVSGFADGLRSRGQTLVASDRLTALMVQAATLAGDVKLPLEKRLPAVSLLGYGEPHVATGALLKLVETSTAPELQMAAVRALGMLADNSVAPSLLTRERWAAASPQLREILLATLLAQPRQVPGLLTALETEAVAVSALDPARRKQLVEHGEESSRKRAVALFKNLESGDRMKVYEDWKSVAALPAKAANGRTVFKKLCAQCHRLEREGVAVGPDLFGMRSQPKEAILLHIIVPEYEIAPGFTAYVLETKDGRTLFGLMAGETATSVTLRLALGVEETVSRSNILSLRSSGLSFMPQEIEKNISRNDMADLVAFLKGEAE